MINYFEPIEIYFNENEWEISLVNIGTPYVCRALIGIWKSCDSYYVFKFLFLNFKIQ